MGSFKDSFGDTPFLPFGDTPLPPEKPIYTRHRVGDMETSVKAARSQKGKMTPKQVRVLIALRAEPAGLSDPELTELMGGPPGTSTWRTRRAELVELGLVYDSGIKRIHNGGSCTVWKAR